MKKALSVVLFLSGTMPIFLGIMCLVAYPSALEMLKLSDSPDVFQAVTLFGVCLIPLGILQYMAGYWTWKNIWQGIVLARYSGLLIVLDGFLLYTILSRPDLGVPDMAKGLLITILSFLCKKN
ncbi:MAG TPA: hypothetical protein VEB40_03105 [Flavipsychrobacter sp.]|nr:hypothetical protein [Flavipsychrobacter sp.]